MFHSLLFQRRFGPLFLAQFFSAFNDNFLKNALVFLILYKLAGPNAEALITMAGALFIAPFFLLSGLGGQLADRFDKALVARRIKLAEIGAAGVAVLGFLLQSLPILSARSFCLESFRRCSDQSSMAFFPITSALRNCQRATRSSKARPLSRSSQAPSRAALRPEAAAIRNLRHSRHALLCPLLGRQRSHSEDRRSGAGPQN